MPQLEKDKLIFKRITDEGLRNKKFHRYDIQTLRGIYCVTHVEAEQLFEQMKPFFVKDKENVTDLKTK